MAPSEEPVIGSAFVPVVPTNNDKIDMCKAWCVWLNSTAGIICFLNTRQKKLTYPSFSLAGLRSLPVPHPKHCDIAALVAAYDKYASHVLRPFSEIHEDPVRHAINKVVAVAVPKLEYKNFVQWRKSIAMEPSVNNEKEPFRLC